MNEKPKTLREWLCLRNVIDFPPLWTILIILIALLLSFSVVELKVSFPMIVSFGVSLCICSFGVMIWCANTLVRAKTPALPHNKAEILVTRGPYRWSRNPIYLADIVLLLSFAFIYQTMWPVLLLPILFLILQKRFVLPEEEMLKSRFPEAFKQWSKKTRRWI